MPPKTEKPEPVQEDDRQARDAPVEHLLQALPHGREVRLLHHPDALPGQSLDQLRRGCLAVVRAGVIPAALTALVEDDPLADFDDGLVEELRAANLQVENVRPRLGFRSRSRGRQRERAGNDQRAVSQSPGGAALAVSGARGGFGTDLVRGRRVSCRRPRARAHRGVDSLRLSSRPLRSPRASPSLAQRNPKLSDPRASSPFLASTLARGVTRRCDPASRVARQVPDSNSNSNRKSPPEQRFHGIAAQ